MNSELEAIFSNLWTLDTRFASPFDQFVRVFDYFGPVVDYVNLKKLAVSNFMVPILYLPFYFDPLIIVQNPAYFNQPKYLFKANAFDLSGRIKTMLANVEKTKQTTDQIYRQIFVSMIHLLYEAQFQFMPDEFFFENYHASFISFFSKQIFSQEKRAFDRHWFQYSLGKINWEKISPNTITQITNHTTEKSPK